MKPSRGAGPKSGATTCPWLRLEARSRLGLALATLVTAGTVAKSAGDGATPTATGADAAVRQLAVEVRNRGWIGYAARSAHGDWDLFACRPDGSDVRPLTDTPEFNEFAPQFSRDGRQLLYRRVPRDEAIDRNRHGEQGCLILAQADAAAPRVFGGPGEFPWASWSPDGRQFACLSLRGVFLVNVADQTIDRTLPRQGFFQQLTWSPDGRWLVGVANSFGTGWSVARMEVASGAVGAVNTVDCCTPDWFPDSRQVIFSWRPPGQPANRGYGWTQLWRADAEGHTRQLVYGEDGRHVYGGQISPDGYYVLFTGNHQEDGDPERAGAPMGLLRLADAPIIGGESRALRALHPEARSGPVLELPIGWEPAWTMADLGSPSASAAKDSANPVAAVSGPRDARTSLASELHDRGWLAFSARTADGDWDLFRMRPDGSDRQALTDTREFNEAGVRFSPDGSRLLYYRMPRAEPVDNNTYGTFDLVIADTAGGTPNVLGREYPWASWGPDGTRIACLTSKGVRVIEVATRSMVREFPRHGIVEQLVWSPDGRHFVGTANGLGPYWNIGCLDPATGTVRAVSETDRYNCTPDWTPDGRGLVYARGIIPEQPGRAELWTVNADGTGRRRVFAEADRHIYGACVSPDSRYVVFTRSVQDLGQVPKIELAIVRWPGPGTENSSPAVRLDLGSGWEPHWTAKDIWR